MGKYAFVRIVSHGFDVLLCSPFFMQGRSIGINISSLMDIRNVFKVPPDDV